MHNPITWLASFFTTEELDAAAEERLEREEGEQIERAANDPFRFRDRASWIEFRRRHGYPTRGLR